MLASLAVAPTAEAQYFGRNKIQYDRFDWHVLETEHFDIYYYPEAQALAEHGAHFAEEIYDELEHRFDFSLNHRVPLIFYSSNLHFKQTNTTPGFIPDGVGGFFEFLKGRVVIPANGDIQRFRRVIRHELVHVFTFSKLTRVLRDHRQPTDRFLPLWFTEGLAEYWSGPPDYQHEMVLRDAFVSNTFVPLHDLERISGTYVMYKEGEAFFRFVADVYGEEKILALIENVWRDRDFREVMEFVLREPFDSVSDRWTDWLEKQYMPLLADAEVPTLVSDAIAQGGVNMKPAVHVIPAGDGEEASRREVVYLANRRGYTNVYAVSVDSLYRPVGEPEVLIRGERSADFEAFHLFESRMDVSDGGLLAFVTQRGATDAIHIYDLRIRSRVGLVHVDQLVAVYSPSWSPDGNKIVFTGIDRSGFSDLYVYDRRSEQLRQLTHDTYDDRDPAWSPDGTQLAFSSDRTALGQEGAYNIFTYTLNTDRIAYVTYGPQKDLSPSWSPDGTRLVFASARPQADGKMGAQDLWVAELQGQREAPIAQRHDAETNWIESNGIESNTQDGGPAAIEAEAGTDADSGSDADFDAENNQRAALATEALATEGYPAHRLTAFTGSAFDPAWTPDGHVVFTTFEHFRFTIRELDLDSLLTHSRETVVDPLPGPHQPWAHGSYAIPDSTKRVRYRRRYQLDVAQGGVATGPNVGTGGGAVLAFSDVLGDDLWYVSAYSANTVDRSFLEGLNLGVTRVHLGQRANYGYGLYRSAGRRYDRADPEAPATFPTYYEQEYGALGLVSYPVSKFRRIELGTSVGWSRKDQIAATPRLETVLVRNAVSLVHDNALYGLNGPEDGWRASVSAGYTTDVLNSNVSYYGLGADVRRYVRLGPGVTVASWGLARLNVGRRARLNLLGGSWSLRGYPFLQLRGRGLWFTSHELRFPLAKAPSAWIPVLEPFGIANLRGALFVDAARLWIDSYNEVEVDPGSGYRTGTVLGSAGAGLRMNLFGALVLRYDVGYRFPDGFSFDEREPYGQFFFGWDF